MDADLIAYLDQRFAEVRAEIAASAARVKDELRADIAATEARLKDGVRADIAATEARLKDGVRADIAASEARLRVDISAETARHIDTVVEDLISKMEVVVDGVRTVDRRVDRFSDEVRDEFQKVDRRLLRLHARISTGRRRRPGR